MHNDDISQILILNKKSISNYESQLFEQELEKFRGHQTRLLQANHKQSALMKELTATFNALLQDKRVRSEQSKYEAIQRQRSSAIGRYKRAYQEFLDLTAGLHGAKNWYGEMRETVGSLEKNVESFVGNRRSEGAQLLNQIEEARSSSKSTQAELERERLQGLMERMSMNQAPTPPPASSAAPTPQPQVPPKPARHTPAPLFQTGQAPRYSHASSYQGGPQSPPLPQQQQYSTYGAPTAYDPSHYGLTPGPTSPPAHQSTFGSVRPGPTSPPPHRASFGMQGQQQVPGNTYGAPMAQQQQQTQQQQVPAGYVPPPPPPGPPPLGPQQTMYGQQQGQGQGQQGQGGYDPWAGLNAWK